VEAIAERRPYWANRVFELFRRVFSWAVEHELLAGPRRRRARPIKPAPRYRVLELSSAHDRRLLDVAEGLLAVPRSVPRLVPGASPCRPVWGCPGRSGRRSARPSLTVPSPGRAVVPQINGTAVRPRRPRYCSVADTARLSRGTRSCTDAQLRWAQLGPTQANVWM
jgi:hypothetical protein